MKTIVINIGKLQSFSFQEIEYNMEKKKWLFDNFIIKGDANDPHGLMHC